MISIQQLTTFFGWCTVINFGLLLFTSFALMWFRAPIAAIHGKLFGLEQAGLAETYFKYVANFKIAAIIFSFVPYVALKFMQ